MEHDEPQGYSTDAKLNWVRAAVLGANDGIVSMAGLVLGVAGATSDSKFIITAAMAGLIAAIISMAAGEYVSVSSSRDTQKALIRKEKEELKNFPEAELDELMLIYERKGLSRKTAEQVAKELTAKDPIMAHLDAELGIDPNDLMNPWHAAGASALAFLLGGIIPIIAIILPPEPVRVPATFISVVIALVLTGTVSATLGGASIPRAVVRVVSGGVLAMVVTNLIGRAFGVKGL